MKSFKQLLIRESYIFLLDDFYSRMKEWFFIVPMGKRANANYGYSDFLQNFDVENFLDVNFVRNFARVFNEIISIIFIVYSWTKLYSNTLQRYFQKKITSEEIRSYKTCLYLFFSWATREHLSKKREEHNRWYFLLLDFTIDASHQRSIFHALIHEMERKEETRWIF